MVNVIIALIIIVFVAIFSVQNAAPVSISFLVWQFQASLAIVIFLCSLCGIAVGAILAFLIRVRKQRKTKMSGQTPSGTAAPGKS
jgi:uncharacterized integral membrane protein